MELDENTAYAIASWHRFDGEVTDDLLRAVAGAFAIVACADGELDASEVDRFVRTVIASELLPKLDPGRLEALFRDVCQSILTDGQAGRRRALGLVAKLKGDAQKAALVGRAAWAAAVADQRLRPEEDEALHQLRDALGLESLVRQGS